MKIFRYLFFVITFIAVVTYSLFFSGIVWPWQYNDAIKTVENWGGLAHLPNDKKDVKILTEGNLFTRTFIIEFTSESGKIDDWVKKSKRLKENFSHSENGCEVYNIYPGENGAMGGTVKISGNHVKIKISWS